MRIFLPLFVCAMAQARPVAPPNGRGFPQQPSFVAYNNDPRVGVKLAPHTIVRFKTPFFDRSNQTNADGFTGRTFLPDKRHYRIAVLGDSLVEGYGVADDRRFTHLTEELVYKKSNRSKAVEMMGFGSAGWGTAHHYGALKHFVLKYRPDEVWFFFGPTNDMGDNSPLFTPPPIGPTLEAGDVLFGHSTSSLKATAELKRLHGQEFYEQNFRNWQYKLLPFYFSPEHDPIWRAMEQHTLHEFTLISRLLKRYPGIKARVIYRHSGYEDTTSPLDFTVLAEKAEKAVGRPLKMQTHHGLLKMKASLEKLGFDMMYLFKSPAVPISTRADEMEDAKHLELADYLSDIILGKIDPHY